MKIKIFIEDKYHEWVINHDPYIVREDQDIYFELTDIENDNETPLLFIEDYKLSLEKYDEGKSFRSVSGRIFRESFGFSTATLYLGEQSFEFRFEVLVKKATAHDVEEMLDYLMQKHNEIIRICFSRTKLPAGTTGQGKSDPETLLSTVQIFVDTLMSSRLESQHHLRKRLVPIKQPAWKASQNCDIDPFDIIFNLDTLEPAFGEGDVVVNGRNFFINEVEVTTLKSTANVEENIILLSGLYSMRRKVTALLNEIDLGFPQSKIRLYDSEYESLSNVLLRLTFANMQHRCKELLIRLEELIRYFEKVLEINYQGGDYRPVMTPFVRAVRIYRRLFEQLYQWYELGEPNLEKRNFLIKLPSVSKIYEFVSLFKIIDYLYERDWLVFNAIKSSSFEFIPEEVTFERGNIKLTLNYEPKIKPYNEYTKHLDLVDTEHIENKDYENKFWNPDFVIKLENNNKAIYLILDAKYSSAWTIKKYSLPNLYDKYFIKMAVYDEEYQLLQQNSILGVIALFHDKNKVAPVYISNWGKYGINKKPVRLPIVIGIPLVSKENIMSDGILDELFVLANNQLNYVK